MKKQFLECGKVVAVHGVRGEVRVQPWCSSPEILAELPAFYLDGGSSSLTPENVHFTRGLAVIKFAGIDSVEAAMTLRGRVLFLNRDDDSLSDGEYYIQDLIGMTVKDADTLSVYGVLCDVSETGANDVYHIKFPDSTVQLIPAIPDVVIKTDVDAGEMLIRPLPGLFDMPEEVL